MKTLLVTFLILFAAYYGWTHYASNGVSTAELSEAQIQTLAASVKPEEVIMYSTNECSYCAQAKGWLQQYGFAFTECNMSVDQRCEAEFKAYGADGTPFLVIRRGGKEYQMKNGFDSDEFLSALKG
ncbi:glutaredoxin family protein [Uliginosibacterium gangwonense]|uniref:glutaredoxin family protein n=1 Tax=Uliginosibacterium gangwonense TaxID=392736 RepID=UPI000360D689|nr:glutaredoxin family protein [Uliginosibacterium gangwonense]